VELWLYCICRCVLPLRSITVTVGSYASQLTGNSDKMLKVDTERIIQYNFGSNWISGFRGVDYNVKVNGRTTDDGRQVMAKVYMPFRVRKAN